MAYDERSGTENVPILAPFQRKRAVAIKVLGVIALTVVLAASAYAEDSASTFKAQAEMASILKAHAEMLGAQAKAHADFVIGTGSVIGVILLALTVVLGLFGIRSIQDVKGVANTQIEATIRAWDAKADTALSDKLNTFNANVDGMIEKTTTEMKTALEQRIQQAEGRSAEALADAFRRISPDSATIGEKTDPGTDAAGKILWVDDHPENNAYETAVLRSAGATIESATTTAEAMHKLTQPGWKLVISDMGRGDDHRAGLDLLRKMREHGNKQDMIFYASEGARKIFEPEATQLGATFTTRPDKLFEATRASVGIPPGAPSQPPA